MFSGHIFSSSFWRSYWVALRRSTRDRRDLKNVIRFTVALVFFIGYYGYVIGSFALNGAGSILLLFAAIIAGALLLRWISNCRDEKAAEREAVANVDVALRSRLAEDGFAIATLLARASSEAMLKQKELPPGVEVITRRAQIEKLKTLKNGRRSPARSANYFSCPTVIGHRNRFRAHIRASKSSAVCAGRFVSMTR